MLIQFKVKNFRSIKDEAIFSTVARHKSDLNSELHRTFTPSAPATKALTRASFIYGSNASGKSTLIKALNSMKNIVVNSNKTNNDDPLPHEPFLFSASHKSAETEFEIEIIAKNVRYQYGFTFNKSRILEEWLFSYPKGKPQKWIMRYYDDDKKTTVYERCDNLQGTKKLWENVTRDNALFLATAVQLKSSQLAPIFEWFSRTLNIIGVAGPSNTSSVNKMIGQDIKAKEQIISFMKAADFGIQNFKVDLLDYEQKFNELPTEVQSILQASDNQLQFVEIQAAHKNDRGELEYLNFEQESDGTQKIFELAGPWLDALTEGKVIVMDEMNMHLHPNLASFLIKLFYNNELNQKFSQLITTTHESNFLKSDIARRDQLWVMSKCQDGSSNLLPFTDYSPRNDENLQRSYLDGRFKGVPVTSFVDIVRARAVLNG